MWISLLIAAGAVGFMATLSRRARSKASAAAPEASPHEAQLLKFVVDEAGQRRGETVALDSDAFIVKTPDGFARIPTDRLQAEGDGLKLTGSVDWEQARKDGEEWRERSHKVITYREDELPKEEA